MYTVMQLLSEHSALSNMKSPDNISPVYCIYVTKPLLVLWQVVPLCHTSLFKILLCASSFIL